MYKVSAIMPALNEQENIGRALGNVIDSFERLHIPGEIVVINDGSQDGTQTAVEQWMKDYSFISVIRHQSPKGIGASFWEGVSTSRGEIVTMVPGDAENDSYEIFRYLPLLEHVDVVVPYAYNGNVRSRGRLWLSRTYTRLINLSFGLTLHYYNGTALYRKSILKEIELKSTGFFYPAELLIKTITAGYLFAEVPYALRSRTAGNSKAVTFRSLVAVSRSYTSTLRAVRFGRNGPARVISPDSATATRWRDLSFQPELLNVYGSSKPNHLLTATDRK